MSPNILLYATAGGAAKDLEVRDTVLGGTDNNTMLGWTAGAGADVMVTDTSSVASNIAIRTSATRISMSETGADVDLEGSPASPSVLGMKF